MYIALPRVCFVCEFECWMLLEGNGCSSVGWVLGGVGGGVFRKASIGWVVFPCFFEEGFFDGKYGLQW